MRDPNKIYYYIDIQLSTRAIVDWGTFTRDQFELEPKDTENYRIFLTKGQYNKLLKALSA